IPTGGGTPLPIPNRAVKPASADGTRRATSRESRSPPNFFQGPRKRPFSLGDCAQFLPPVGIEPSQPAHALADRWMRDEECSETLLGEGIEDVERLGRRIRAELDQLRSLLEPDQRVGEPVRRAAELGGAAIGIELALRREHEM